MTGVPSDRQARICLCGEHGFVPLTRGRVSFIDPEDVPLIVGYLWHARRDYAVRMTPSGETIRLQNVISPPPEGCIIDHRDRDGLNNRKANLRPCRQGQNVGNKSKPRKSRNPYKGIQQTSQGRWTARIRAFGKHVHLGTFATPEEAARVYDEAAQIVQGEFACTNAMLGLIRDPDAKRGAA